VPDAPILGRVAKGGTLAIAMSEPDSGSDVAWLKTSARLEGGEWVLDGANPAYAATLLGFLPGPARLMYRALWEPKYRNSPRLR